MSVAVCPGSFDPITNGHLDVIRRARTMFGTVVVAIAENPSKTYRFTVEERVAFAREACAGMDGVRVEAVSGLLAEYCRTVGAVAIVKGIRGAADVDGEVAQALMNRELTGIDTVFVPGDPAWGHIASSLVKDVARHGGDVSAMVPSAVAQALMKH